MFSEAVSREKAIDLRKSVNWEKLEQITLGATTTAG